MMNSTELNLNLVTKLSWNVKYNLQFVLNKMENRKATIINFRLLKEVIELILTEIKPVAKIIQDLENNNPKITKENVEIAWLLGYCYDYGIGVFKNYSKSVQYYEFAKYYGEINSLVELGVDYYYGISITGFNKNPKLAAEYYECAARLGNARAQFLLGELCDLGHGIDKNPDKAKKYFEFSAQQGYAPAECLLGEYYDNGFGVTKDAQTAFDLYRKSASKGYPRALYNLGWSLEHDKAKNKNNIAIKYYMLAAHKGHQDAKSRLKTLLSGGQIIFEKELVLLQQEIDQDLKRNADNTQRLTDHIIKFYSELSELQLANKKLEIITEKMEAQLKLSNEKLTAALTEIEIIKLAPPAPPGPSPAAEKTSVPATVAALIAAAPLATIAVVAPAEAPPETGYFPSLVPNLIYSWWGASAQSSKNAAMAGNKDEKKSPK